MCSKVSWYIVGTVCSGQGGASKAMQGERLRDRSEVAGMKLVPGTLNVQVDDIGDALAFMGEPATVTETSSKVGPLRWWPVSVSVEGVTEAEAWVVRHERTGTRYLEIVSGVNFRAAGAPDGSMVVIEPR